MDKVLVVDDNLDNLSTLKEGLQKFNQFEVLTAPNGEEAIITLEAAPVSLLVTDIKMPKVDGLELLAYMTKSHPTTPCIVMTGYGTPEVRKKISEQDVLHYIEKPFDFNKLAWVIIEGLDLLDEGVPLRGMTVSRFLPLIEMAKKTCRVEVQSIKKGKGFFYFENGILNDAHHKNLRGEEAALEMITWDKMEIVFSDLPKRRARKRIKSSLIDLIRKAMNLKSDSDVIEQDAEPEAASHELLEKEDETPEEEITEDEPQPIETATEEITEEKPQPKETVSGEITDEEKEELEIAFETHIDELNTIVGYQALGIIDFKGEIIAIDKQDKDLNFDNVWTAISDIFKYSKTITAGLKIDECTEMTLHTKKNIFLMISPKRNLKTPFHMIAILSVIGNWYYMKIQLEKVMSKIESELR